jgi:hypothetical protein
MEGNEPEMSPVEAFRAEAEFLRRIIDGQTELEVTPDIIIRCNFRCSPNFGFEIMDRNWNAIDDPIYPTMSAAFDAARALIPERK